MRCKPVFVLVAGLLLTVHAGAQGLADFDGGQLFERFCASCHGLSGKGDGPVAQAMPALVPDLTRLSDRHGGNFPEDDVRKIIDGRAVVVYHGTRYMPVWGYEFWVEEGADIEAESEVRNLINRLVAFLREIQRSS